MFKLSEKAKECGEPDRITAGSSTLWPESQLRAPYQEMLAFIHQQKAAELGCPAASGARSRPSFLARLLLDTPDLRIGRGPHG